jgi:hypothetical protein
MTDQPNGLVSAPHRSAGELYLENARFEFGRLRRMAEAAIAQTPDHAALHCRLSEGGNSIAILMRHLAGNMRSRWTEFLTTDGEKPGRNRESEFDPCDRLSRDELLAEWREAFALLEENLAELGPADLGRTIRIRGEAFLVQEAIERQVLHLAYHTGQIVLLAKAFTPEWRSLSIPRGVDPNTRRYKQ